MRLSEMMSTLAKSVGQSIQTELSDEDTRRACRSRGTARQLPGKPTLIMVNQTRFTQINAGWQRNYRS